MLWRTEEYLVRFNSDLIGASWGIEPWTSHLPHPLLTPNPLPLHLLTAFPMFLFYCYEILDHSYPKLTHLFTPHHTGHSPTHSAFSLSPRLPLSLGPLPGVPGPTGAVLVYTVTSRNIPQWRHHLGGLDRINRKRKVGPLKWWGAEEWWGHCYPLNTLTVLRGGQSLVRSQQHVGL